LDDLRTPLRFERVFLEKVWGGRSLERTPGIDLPEGVRVGETWEVVDREDVNSVVADGPLAGRTLHDLVVERPQELLGRATATPEGRFPLLVKYIDAADELSVQVHPDEESAERVGGEAKTEAWYFLGSEPGARILAGLRPEVDREALARAAREGGVDELLLSWDAVPGQCFHVPGGTMHAICRGVTLLEVQQNSDTTYRVWDWDRVGLDGHPRDLHVEQALEVAHFGAETRPPITPAWESAGENVRRARLARSPWFGMNSLSFAGRARMTTGGQFQIYVVVGGAGSLEVQESGSSSSLAPGDVLLLPAACGFHWIEPEEGGLELVQLLARP
jgi:mannose-6-phosphate isomerase